MVALCASQNDITWFGNCTARFHCADVSATSHVYGCRPVGASQEFKNLLDYDFGFYCLADDVRRELIESSAPSPARRQIASRIIHTLSHGRT
jgi:hypothetical protein